MYGTCSHTRCDWHKRVAAVGRFSLHADAIGLVWIVQHDRAMLGEDVVAAAAAATEEAGDSSAAANGATTAATANAGGAAPADGKDLAAAAAAATVAAAEEDDDFEKAKQEVNFKCGCNIILLLLVLCWTAVVLGTFIHPHPRRLLFPDCPDLYLESSLSCKVCLLPVSLLIGGA